MLNRLSPMTSFATSLIRASVALGLLAAGLVLTSCDLASASNTAILSANSTSPPTVRHRFEYSQGQLNVVSTVESENHLGDILAQNGFRRSNVVSARVDSVLVTPVSTASLSRAEIYLGTDANGPHIASVQFQPDQPSPVVDHATTSVTGAVKSGDGDTKTFAQFSVEDPSGIPTGGSVVRATVYYRIEVEGV